jgi:hypothetical protein
VKKGRYVDVEVLRLLAEYDATGAVVQGSGCFYMDVWRLVAMRLRGQKWMLAVCCVALRCRTEGGSLSGRLAVGSWQTRLQAAASRWLPFLVCATDVLTLLLRAMQSSASAVWAGWAGLGWTGLTDWENSGGGQARLFI